MAKVAYLRTIEDELLDPYYITMDDYCYTLHEDLSKKKGFGLVIAKDEAFTENDIYSVYKEARDEILKVWILP